MADEKIKKHIDDLKKEMLETGILDQQKIEDIVASENIEKIELSEEAKEMKKMKNKVSSIFDKHLKKEK